MHFFKQCIAFCTKMYYPCTSFQWKWLTPWGVLQVAVRRVIRLVHRRIRTGRDIYRTGCFLFSVSVRVAECHHRCTTIATTLRCGTSGRKQTNRTQTASDLWHNDKPESVIRRQQYCAGYGATWQRPQVPNAQRPQVPNAQRPQCHWRGSHRGSRSPQWLSLRLCGQWWRSTPASSVRIVRTNCRSFLYLLFPLELQNVQICITKCSNFKHKMFKSRRKSSDCFCITQKTGKIHFSPCP